MDDHVPAARLTGLLYGTLQLAYLFPGLAITLLAEEMRTSADSVQLIQGASAIGGVVVTGYWLWRRAKLPPRWRLATSAAVLGGALIALGLRPSVLTLFAALAIAASVAPSSMLVRDAILGQFAERRGRFLEVCQTWTHSTRGLGGLAFILAILGVLEVSDAILALGVAVLGVAVAYARWPRLRACAVREAGSRAAGSPSRLSLRRLTGSGDLLKGLLATLGIYGAFQLLWSELQPRIAALGVSDKWASLWVAVFGLTALLSIPWIRKHSRQSDEDATPSAADASRMLVMAAGFGLLTLLSDCLPTVIAVAAVGVFAGWVEIGGNATSAPVTKGLSEQDPRSVLLASLARHLAAMLGGIIAATVAWTEAVWWTVAFALLAWLALRHWREHPVNGDQAQIQASCRQLRLRLVEPRGGPVGSEGPTSFLLEISAQPGESSPWTTLADGWEIWRRDTIRATGPLHPDQERSEQTKVLRIRFDWPLGRADTIKRSQGKLSAGAPAPLCVDAERRATLHWHYSQPSARWSIDADGATVIDGADLSNLELVHFGNQSR